MLIATTSGRCEAAGTGPGAPLLVDVCVDGCGSEFVPTPQGLTHHVAPNKRPVPGEMRGMPGGAGGRYNQRRPTMSRPEAETCWTIIGKASRGDRDARDAFVRTYWPVVHFYLSSRWKRSRLLHDLDDAIQEVFLDCFRARGALGRAQRGRTGGFRAFLFGIVRNVALRAERRARDGRSVEYSDELVADDSSLQDDSASRLFDRAWAQSILRATVDRLETQARTEGPEPLRRVDLLRLRFHDGLPIRDIAARWGVDPAHLHHEFARARKEFKAALMAEVAFHVPGTAEEIERECARIPDLLV